MDRVVSIGGRFPPSRLINHGDALKPLKSPVPVAGLFLPLSFKTCFWKVVSLVMIFALTALRIVSAQPNFTVPSTSYNCSSNIICNGGAHVYNLSDDRIQVGRLSLVPDPSRPNTAGIAYYNQPIRFLDASTRQSASFNTSFTIDTTWGMFNGTPIGGDGMAFVISADNTGTGGVGGLLGFFDDDTAGSTTFKSVVVEFDTYWDPGSPAYDISNNHVSFDFHNISWVAAANASDLSTGLTINLADEITLYAWVEYSSETKTLELRVAANDRRPISPILNYTVDLFDVVEEYMWVGFSSGTGDWYSNFYIGSWSFESYGLSVPSPPSPAPTPSSLGGPSGSSLPLGGHKSGGSKVGIIVGISVGIPTLLLICMIIALYVWKRPGGSRGGLGLDTFTEEDPMIPFGGMPLRQYSYKQLSMATGGFNEDSKLGQGGFGSVYRGVLPESGIPVAVKKISGNSTQGEKEFMTEVYIISQLRHRNLIQVLGWCKDTTSSEKYLLVYEQMPNGSLDKALYGPTESQTPILSWKQRVNIVTGIAAALEYLHQGWNQQIIHRDVKSSNIMLDEDWNAKLGDFGLARLVDHQKEAATTLMAGTYGYIAPEVAASGKFTEKTDVFAFGAVVLEVACGRRALSGSVPEDEMILVNWVWHHLSLGDLMSTVDKRLQTDYDADLMERILIIGLLCSHPDPLVRPSMRRVVQVLSGDAPVPSISESKPAAAIGANNSHRPLHSSKHGSGSKSRSGSLSLVSTSTSDATRESTMKSFETSSST